MIAQLSQEDFQKFQKWLDFHWNEITREGRHRTEFNELWDIFFCETPSILEMMERFDFILEKVTTGPLYAWFSWLKERFLVYCFVSRDLSIHDMAQESGLDVSYLAYIYRDFFIDLFPDREELFDDKFQVGNVISANLSVKFSDVRSELDLQELERGISEEDIMRGIEVTLYPEWKKLTKIIQKEFVNKKFDLSVIREKTTIYRQLKFLREVVVLFILGILAIKGLEKANEIYEEQLAEKIRIFEPVFKWLDQDKTYKAQTVEDKKIKLELELKAVEFESKTDGWSEEFRPGERSGTETEVILTSADNLPKDFDHINIERSDYEETRKGSFRDLRYGRRKVFRILMSSEDSQEIRTKLTQILDMHKVVQADNVKPGIEIPGGIYYNLFVPVKNLKKFLGSLSEISGTKIFESQNRGRNPPGKNKVFIWIKRI